MEQCCEVGQHTVLCPLLSWSSQYKCAAVCNLLSFESYLNMTAPCAPEDKDFILLTCPVQQLGDTAWYYYIDIIYFTDVIRSVTGWIDWTEVNLTGGTESGQKGEGGTVAPTADLNEFGWFDSTLFQASAAENPFPAIFLTEHNNWNSLEWSLQCPSLHFKKRNLSFGSIIQHAEDRTEPGPFIPPHHVCLLRYMAATDLLLNRAKSSSSLSGRPRSRPGRLLRDNNNPAAASKLGLSHRSQPCLQETGPSHVNKADVGAVSTLC